MWLRQEVQALPRQIRLSGLQIPKWKTPPERAAFLFDVDLCCLSGPSTSGGRTSSRARPVEHPRAIAEVRQARAQVLQRPLALPERQAWPAAAGPELADDQAE